MLKHLTAVVAGMALFSACTESSPDLIGVDADFGVNSAGPSASGHTNLTLGGGLQTFSFHATEKADGTVQGSFQGKSRGQGQWEHGYLDCLRIEGNVAWVSGQVTAARSDDDASFEINVGDNVWLRVLDDGEGSGSNDQWTDVWIFNTEDCNNNEPYGFGFVPDYLDNEAGNVQVKP